MRRADWLVDVGPDAGENGGQRPLQRAARRACARSRASHTRALPVRRAPRRARARRASRSGWLELRGITRNNLHDLDARFPLGVFTAVTGVSGSGKSSLVSQALVELVCRHLGHEPASDDEDAGERRADRRRGDARPASRAGIERDPAAGARRPEADRPHAALEPRDLHRACSTRVRKLFAATPAARARRYDAGRFSFNVAKGRCETCEGEGFVSVELLFMPSVYAPCPTCHGARYNDKTLEITWRGKQHRRRAAHDASTTPARSSPTSRRCCKPLALLRDIGLGYLRLGQPATELSGGEAQRIKLATELQRSQRGDSLYVLDEPTTGLHPADVDKLMAQLQGLVDAGNTVIVVEHEDARRRGERLGDRRSARAPARRAAGSFAPAGHRSRAEASTPVAIARGGRRVAR